MFQSLGISMWVANHGVHELNDIRIYIWGANEQTNSQLTVSSHTMKPMDHQRT